MGDGTLTYTVDEALMSLRFGKFQALVLAYSGMGWISEAMEMMLLSFVGLAVQSEWKLSSHQESLITSVVFAGMLLGAYSWGIVSDNYGRRNGFLFTALVTTGAGFAYLSSFAPNYLSLIILRFMVGIGLGGGPVLCSWFLEFIPAPNRGFWMVIFQAFWTVGTLLEASLAWAVMPKFGWRWLLALSSFPSFLLLVFYAVTPESPRYLCMKGRMADAMHVLEKVAMLNHAKLPSGMLISDHKIELDEKPNPSGFELDGQKIPGLILSAAIVDRIGRKLTMSAILFLSCFFVFPLAFHQTEALTTALLFGARICISGSFIVVYIYAPEIYPTSVRTTGIGTASSVGRIGGIMCPLVAVGMLHTCHQMAAIILFEVVIFLSGLAVCFFPFETSGRILE